MRRSWPPFSLYVLSSSWKKTMRKAVAGAPIILPTIATAANAPRSFSLLTDVAIPTTNKPVPTALATPPPARGAPTGFTGGSDAGGSTLGGSSGLGAAGAGSASGVGVAAGGGGAWTSGAGGSPGADG